MGVSKTLSKIGILYGGGAVTFSIKYKTDNALARPVFKTFPSNSGNIIANLESEGSYTTLTYTTTSPSTDTYIELYFALRAKSLGSTGSVWFKDLSITSNVQHADIVKTYDQSGNGFDETQTDTTKQPRLVNAGIINRSGIRPAIYFDATNDWMVNVSTNLSSIMSISLVNQCLIPSSDKRLVYLTTTAETTNGYIISQTSANSMGAGQRYPTNVTTATANNSVGTNQGITSYTRATPSSQKVWYNGTFGLYEQVGVSDSVTLTKVYLGYAGTNQYISEFAVMAPLTDAERQKLERNQSKYYSITIA
jgi:hypothetical protein